MRFGPAGARTGPSHTRGNHEERAPLGGSCLSCCPGDVLAHAGARSHRSRRYAKAPICWRDPGCPTPARLPPLYRPVTRVLGTLPFGSLRIDQSHVGCLWRRHVALVFLCGRRAGAGRFASAVGSYGCLACGPLFWSTAVGAEVYTIHTALLAAILLSVAQLGSHTLGDDVLRGCGFVAPKSGASHDDAASRPGVRGVCAAGRLAFRSPTSSTRPHSWRTGARTRSVWTDCNPDASRGRLCRNTGRIPWDALAAVPGRRWQSSVFAFDIAALLRDRVPFVAERLAREFSWPGTIAVTSGVLYVLGVCAAGGAAA